MNIQTLKNQISENIATTQQLKNELYQKKHELEKLYDAQIFRKEKWLSALEEEYKEKAIEIAIKNNACPSSRWGNSLEPTSFHISEQGLFLEWEHEYAYSRSDYDHYSITWEEFFEEQENK